MVKVFCLQYLDKCRLPFFQCPSFPKQIWYSTPPLAEIKCTKNNNEEQSNHHLKIAISISHVPLQMPRMSRLENECDDQEEKSLCPPVFVEFAKKQQHDHNDVALTNVHSKPVVYYHRTLTLVDSVIKKQLLNVDAVLLVTMGQSQSHQHQGVKG